MVPHIYMYDQLMLERIRKWQREAKQEQMLAGLCEPHYGIVRYLIGCLGTFFVAPGTGMQHLEQAVCNGTRDSVPSTKDTLMNPQIYVEEQLNMGTDVHRQNGIIPNLAFLWEPSRENYRAA